VTVAPDVPRLVVREPGEAIRALRASGLRLSTARRLVIEALFAADGPVSAAQLAQTLSLEESSVYRNLEVLERHGLTRHVHLGHGPGLYALVGRDDGEYLYCERCRKLTVLRANELAPVREQIIERFGHTARFTHFAIVGICRPCSSAHRNASIPVSAAPTTSA
jgi:Fur family ferric uptake transcriptional regulator